MVDEAIEKRALALENLHVCGRQIEPGCTVDLWKSPRLSTLWRPFDLERVACDRIGVELALDGERRHPLAPALPDVAQRLKRTCQNGTCLFKKLSPRRDGRVSPSSISPFGIVQAPSSLCSRKARPDAPAGLPTRTCPPVSEFQRSKPCISIGKGIAKDEAASDAFCTGNTVARGLQSALFLGCWLFVLIRRLGWHVAWLGFVCRLGAFLVRGLLLAPFVKNDTVAFFVCWHG
jgi:hypothetical protein